MYEAYKRHSNPPIWKAFKIEVMSKDSSNCVIDATPLFLSSIAEFSPFPDLPAEVRMIVPFGGSFQSDRSKIEEFKAFEDNIKKSIVTRAEMAFLMSEVKDMGINDYNKIAFCIEYTGIKP